MRTEAIATPDSHVSPDMRAAIVQRLSEIEGRHGVRVLYAAESGSRAWGFPSPDSDYDVRFIYVHPRDWYLSVNEARDVIEEGVDAMDFDVAGWDLRKALRLFLKANPALWEWLVSPIAYRDIDGVAQRLRDIAARGYSLKALAHHYLSITHEKERRTIAAKQTVKAKKYVYALRPLLALDWLRERETLPPMAMPEIMNGVTLPDDVRQAILDLVAHKAATPEGAPVQRIPLLDGWMDEAYGRGRAYAEGAPARKTDREELDALFRQIVLAGDE
ncbi:MAG: nucleotidyltransferase domain-containing protein [Alphaproteobacteria bacterium]|nr:nucleotidyltransferase domain-containing protein [Alphaproteobacteria bacterium]